MQRKENIQAESGTDRVSVSQRAGGIWRSIVTVISVVAVLFLALYNLTDYPPTWFDEGAHLHVPKTIVRFGVYADYSSEGFRYYGPTVGVGPTVMLPIAAVFQLFGIGFLQARLVIALYLLAAIYVFYRLARGLGGQRLAWVATALVIASQGVSLLEYGRQVLGEVPGFFFMVAGLALWFAAWERSSWQRLGLVGLLLGLAMVTKSQYLLILAPTLGLAWIANLVYYRTAPQRVFIVPGVVAAVCFAIWQVCMIVYLGPETAGENLRLMREAVSIGAVVFSPDLMEQSVKYLLSLDVYMGGLVPVLAYGLVLALRREREAQRWGTLLVLVAVNLGWYAFASIGWTRYAFPGLAIAALFVARLFHDLTDGFRLNASGLWQALRQGQPALREHALRWTMLLLLFLMFARPMLASARQVVSPGFNATVAMAAYLDEHVSHEVLIETFEPEMGFFTDHNYHFPPRSISVRSTAHASLGGPPAAQYYDFVQTEYPDYVLLGPVGDWAGIYPANVLAEHYRLVTTIGRYELYEIDE